jgi:hypothetical protein
MTLVAESQRIEALQRHGVSIPLIRLAAGECIGNDRFQFDDSCRFSLFLQFLKLSF